MKRICIQPGHVNKGGGAPNELETNKRVADRVSALLRERAFEVYQTDANGYNDPKVTTVNYDLFLSLHCDMDYPDDNGGGFADFPEPKTDGATNESQRICKIINDFYFKEVGIVYKNRSNSNTRYYYMWKYLTLKTPCVLIEMGQSIDPHDSVLLGNTELIATALVRAICQAFGVAYDLTPPVVEPSNCEKELDYQKGEVTRLNLVIEQAKLDLDGKLAQKDVDCQSKFDTFKNYLIKTIQEYK